MRATGFAPVRVLGTLGWCGFVGLLGFGCRQPPHAPAVVDLAEPPPPPVDLGAPLAAVKAAPAPKATAKGAAPAADGDDDKEVRSSDSVSGALLAIDAKGQPVTLADASVWLVCTAPDDESEGADCKSRLAVEVPQAGKPPLTAKLATDVPGLEVSELSTDSKTDGLDTELSVTLKQTGLGTGGLIVVNSSFSAGVWEKASREREAWYVLRLDQPPRLVKVLDIPALNSSSKDDTEEDGPTTSESTSVSAAFEDKVCGGLRDVTLTTVTESSITRRKTRSHTKTSRTHYTFNGEAYVAGRAGKRCVTMQAACSARKLGACGGACTRLDTIENCGACGNACLGGGQPGSEAQCLDPKTRQCQLLCSGDRFDLDGDARNGCEARLPAALKGPIDLGDRGCDDAGSALQLKTRLFVDERPHRDPQPATFDPATGAAPLTVTLRGQGGPRCLNDLFVRAKTDGGGPKPCYKLTVTGTASPHEVALSGQGEGVITVPARAYTSGAQLTLTLRRTCPPAREQVGVLLDLHL